MLKACLLTGGLLLTAMVGTTSASTIGVGDFVTAGAIISEGHSYGDDGMVFSAVPTAQCVAVLNSPGCAPPDTFVRVDGPAGEPEPRLSWVRTPSVAGHAAMLSALGLPSSFLVSDSSSLGRYLLSLDPDAPIDDVRAAVAAAGFILPGDLGVGAQTSPMPEPMSLLFVGAGLAGLGAVLRRRRA